MILQILEHPSTLSKRLSSFIIDSGDYAQLGWILICLPFIFLVLYSTWLSLSSNNNKLGSEKFFLLITAIGLIILRYPSYAAGEINPDEAEWIAGAATLINDPRFWLSVDGTTSGPLNIFPLGLIYLFNIKISFATARLFCNIFLLIPAIYFTYFAIKYFFSQTVARMVIVPLIIFLFLTSHFDLNFYSSEYVPILLLSVLTYLYALFNKKPRNLILIGAGIGLGLLPFSKLQSLPIGFIIGLFFLIDILLNRLTTGWGKVKAILIFFSTGLAPTIITIIYLFYVKALYDFWQSYILNNIVYGSAVPLGNTLIAPLKIILKYTQSAIPYYVIVAIIPVIGIYYYLTSKNQKLKLTNKLFWFVHLLFLAAYYAIGKGWEFPHYQLFLLLPLTLLNAFYLQLINTSNQLNFSILMLVFYAVLSILLLLPGNVLLAKVLADKNLPEKNPASIRILKYAKPNDKLVVWGFQDILGSNGVYYLETGLIQGTRESHSQRPEGHMGITQLKYYQERFLKNIQENEPVALLDISKADTSNNFYLDLRNYISQYYYLDTIMYRNQAGINASGRAILEPGWISSKVYILKNRSKAFND